MDCFDHERRDGRSGTGTGTGTESHGPMFCPEAYQGGVPDNYLTG